MALDCSCHQREFERLGNQIKDSIETKLIVFTLRYDNYKAHS